jgi:hypothetical protein
MEARTKALAVADGLDHRERCFQQGPGFMVVGIWRCSVCSFGRTQIHLLPSIEWYARCSFLSFFLFRGFIVGWHDYGWDPITVLCFNVKNKEQERTRVEDVGVEMDCIGWSGVEENSTHSFPVVDVTSLHGAGQSSVHSQNTYLFSQQEIGYRLPLSI